MKTKKIYTILAAGAIIANAMSPLAIFADENKISDNKENKEVQVSKEATSTEVAVSEVTEQNKPEQEVTTEEVNKPETSEETTTLNKQEVKPVETTEEQVKTEVTTEENKTTEVVKQPQVKQVETPAVVQETHNYEQPSTNVHVDVTTNTSSFSYKYDFDNDTVKFVASIAEQARVIGKKNDLYASVMIAQAILESGSGTSQLSQAPNNNLFGIKGAYNGQSVTFLTSEDDGSGNLYQIHDSFRKYETTAQSLEDYADLIKESGYYTGAWI